MCSHPDVMLEPWRLAFQTKAAGMMQHAAPSDFGDDSAMAASFLVNEETLKRIRPGMSFDEAGLLSAFDVLRNCGQSDGRGHRAVMSSLLLTFKSVGEIDRLWLTYAESSSHRTPLAELVFTFRNCRRASVPGRSTP